MRLRCGKKVESLVVNDDSDGGSQTGEDDHNDDVSDSDEESFHNGRKSTHEIITLAIHKLNEIKSSADEDNQAEGKITSSDKIIPGKVRELVADMSRYDLKNEKLHDVSSSCFNIGSYLHRSYKRVVGHSLVRLVVKFIMFLTSLLLLLNPYSKRSSAHKNQNAKKVYKGMMTRRRSIDASSEQATDAPKMSFIPYMIYTVNVMVLLLVLWKISHYFVSLPNARGVGLDNCNEIMLPLSSRIHAWHILPPRSANLSISEALHLGLPIVFHARNTGVLSGKQRVDILKALSLNNLHILAPVSPLSDVQTVQVWSNLNKVSKNSVIYMWFGEGDVNTIKMLASAMCSIGYPPSGIILETKKIADKKIHGMDIWSSSCKSKSQNEMRKFNFLKCPISTQAVDSNTYEDISSCLRAIEAGIFTAY